MEHSTWLALIYRIMKSDGQSLCDFGKGTGNGKSMWIKKKQNTNHVSLPNRITLALQV